MNDLPLNGKTILITGAARRIGRKLATACAKGGANVVIHHAHSDMDAGTLKDEITGLGRKAWVYKADFSDSSQTRSLIPLICQTTPVHYLINNASIFEATSFTDVSQESWDRHIQINLTAPFLLAQSFAAQALKDGRIINILDWRAMRPGADHFPYTISKAALAAMTRSMAVSLAPDVLVNGLALGAILPPSDGTENNQITQNIPLQRWAKDGEVESAILFLLTCPGYITGEIIHVDGGRHLV